jgi:hypothetical protein
MRQLGSPDYAPTPRMYCFEYSSTQGLRGRKIRQYHLLDQMYIPLCGIVASSLLQRANRSVEVI